MPCVALVERPADPGSTASDRRISLFGLPIDDVTMDETLDRIDAFIASGGVHQHVVVNVSKIVQASRDPEIRAIVESCDLVNVDGQPVIWASRLVGRPLRARVTGVDLMHRLIEGASSRGHRLYFLGARPEVVGAVIRRVEREHPAVIVAGWRDGYWSRSDEEDIVRSIAAARPDILFVALGSPAKERFLARWKATIGAPFVMGVGGSFDVYAGITRRAPRWMQRAGLEWLFRVSQEPTRLWRRYAGDSVAFAWIVVREVVAARRPGRA
jgi:N-acetylglucosaminyldiphosphoundecaprenol N-acetyl-beta-D-mannosaminyltransferase